MNSRNMSIMIIDDSVMDSFLLYQLLTSANQNDPVIKFESAFHALNYIEDCIERKAFSELPDLIFLDINMPLFNGFQFLNKIMGIREMNNCKVAMTTSSDDPKDIKKSAEYANVIGFLIKPLIKEDLMHIESLLEKVFISRINY